MNLNFTEFSLTVPMYIPQPPLPLYLRDPRNNQQHGRRHRGHRRDEVEGLHWFRLGDKTHMTNVRQQNERQNRLKDLQSGQKHDERYVVKAQQVFPQHIGVIHYGAVTRRRRTEIRWCRRKISFAGED